MGTNVRKSFKVKGQGHRVNETAFIPAPSRYKNLAYTCLFIARFKSYTRPLNTEFELCISPYAWL